MTDWTTARVVRQEDAGLFFRTDDPLVHATGPTWRDQQGATWTLRDMAGLLPFTPVLDADGLPVVHTVGDLTARHVGKRVRVDGSAVVLHSLAAALDGVLLLSPDGAFRVTSDTPCEVLP